MQIKPKSRMHFHFEMEKNRYVLDKQRQCFLTLKHWHTDGGEKNKRQIELIRQQQGVRLMKPSLWVHEEEEEMN